MPVFHWPVDSRIISGRFLDIRGYGPHAALDIAETYGDTLRSIHSIPTTVLFAGRSGSCGRTVWLKDALGYRSHYCHLSSWNVVTGQNVSVNGIIGKVGGSGLTGDYDYGSHCHLNLFFPKKPITGPSIWIGWVGMWAVDPELYLGKEIEIEEEEMKYRLIQASGPGVYLTDGVHKKGIPTPAVLIDLRKVLDNDVILAVSDAYLSWLLPF